MMGLISKEEGPGFTAECQPVFPLQRLPPELRNEIYRYVLVFPGPVRPVRPSETLSARRYQRAVHLHKVVGLSSIVVPDPNPPPTCLTLLAVDKATYKEAMPIFYAENHFEFDNCTRLTRFLSSISPSRQSWLHRLTINVYATTPHAKRAFDILRERAERLKVMHVRVPFRWLKGKNLPATNVEPWTFSVEPRKDMRWAFAMRGIRGLDEFVLYQNWTGEESDNMEVISAEAWFKEEMMKPKPKQPEEGSKHQRAGKSRSRSPDGRKSSTWEDSDSAGVGDDRFQDGGLDYQYAAAARADDDDDDDEDYQDSDTGSA